MTCPHCDQQTPEGNYCVRCGGSLRADERKRRFGAAPREGVMRPSVISSIFPQLPEADMATFRVALVIGVAGVVVLGILGLFPLAVVLAAILVPLLTVLYLYDVDVYEDEPVQVIAVTMLWGAVAGIGYALLADAVAPTDASFIEASGTDELLRTVVLPLISAVLMLLGPLALLPYRRFNDALDGVTFGAAAAVTFAGAATITQAFDFFSAGLRPGGEVWPWIVRLLELAMLQPVLAAAVIGSTGGAFWLRYRAPVKDRNALGVLGRPLVAWAAAAVLLVVAALGQFYLPEWLALVLYLVLDAVALLWLRQVIDLGLEQEAAEIEIGPDITCANCGATTARHSYCRNCGISLLALPKERHPGSTE